MNIQLLTPNFLKNRNDIITRSNRSGLNANMASYPNLRPLEKDTVSFGAKTKFVIDATESIENIAKKKVSGEWDYETPISRQDIIDLAKNFEKPLRKFTRDLREELRSLVTTDSKPNNPIMPGAAGIKSRVKTFISIERKANDRHLYTIDEVAKMGDVGGVRIILRDSSPENVALVFDALGNMIKKGAKVKEVENWRASKQTSYVSQSTLDSFEELCHKYGQYPEMKAKALENNYTAIHMTFELPDGKLIELQIMGRDMENVKEVEDFYYKWRCNKMDCIDDKYRPIVEVFEKHMPTLTPFQQESLQNYIKDSYDHALTIPPMSAKRKPRFDKDYFLPFPYHLPQELSYKNIYEMMGECQVKTKK